MSGPIARGTMDTQATKNTLTGISALVEKALANEAPGGLVSRHGYAVERHGERHLVLLRNGEKLAEAFRPDYPPHLFYGDGSSDTRAANTFLTVVGAGVDVDELRRQAKARQDYFRRINRFRRNGNADTADKLTLEAMAAMASPARVPDPLDGRAETESDDVLDLSAPDPLADRIEGQSAVYTHCRICGHRLGRESQSRGIGPECLGKVA
jgi:hypothetical protein